MSAPAAGMGTPAWVDLNGPPTRAARRRGFDAPRFLTFYLVVLLAVPSPMIFAPLGTVGSPAMLLALVAFVWWAWHHLHRGRLLSFTAHPVRMAALGFLLVLLLVYGHAMTQPLPLDEVTPADSGIFRMLGMMGLVLLAHDGITRIDLWHRILHRLAVAGGLIAILAIVQFATRQVLVDQLPLPGLTTPPSIFGVLDRAGLGRPIGTATHPIELGAVLGMILPLAVTDARITRGSRWLAWSIVALMGLAIMLTLSRTAIISLVLGVAILMPAWSKWSRIWFVLAAGVAGIAAGAVIPGLLGTLRGLFLGAATDPSVLSRTQSYGVAWEFITQNPWLGRGYGTFGPKYWIVDNLYLQFIIEAGIVGVLALLALLLSTMWAARTAALTFSKRAERELARALLGSVVAGAASLAFFDAFSFPQSAGLLFLMVGLAGAGFNLARHEKMVLSSSAAEQAAAQRI